MAPYFDVVEQKADDSTVFRLVERIPDKVIDEASSFDFSYPQQLQLMDRAIERMNGDNRHLRIAKAQLHRQNGDVLEARKLIDRLRAEVASVKDDPYFESYISFVEYNLLRNETAAAPTPEGFIEKDYLAANPDVAAAVERGDFDTGLSHWFMFGIKEGRSWHPK